MNNLKRLIVGAVTASILAASVSLAAPANATQPQPVSDAVRTVKEITAKAPGLLNIDAVITEQHAMVGTSRLGRGSEPLVGAIAAGDAQNSVVASTKDSQSLIAVLEPGESSADFFLSIPDGYVAELTNSGGVQLRNPSSRIVVPFIKAPWALDANGKKLQTFYTVKDSKITQHVDTDGAAYPVVADPTVQWIPYPVIAMYGWQANTIAKSVATVLTAAPGASCTLIAVGGWVGKAFSAVCSLVGLGSAKDVFRNIANVWKSNTGLAPWGCYGFQIWFPGAKPVALPARDCA